MKTEVLKTLWILRFEKMKRLEQEAAWTYQGILEAFLREPDDYPEEIKLLRELVQDEKSHTLLAEELIRISRLTHPECSVL